MKSKNRCLNGRDGISPGIIPGALEILITHCKLSQTPVERYLFPKYRSRVPVAAAWAWGNNRSPVALWRPSLHARLREIVSESAAITIGKLFYLLFIEPTSHGVSSFLRDTRIHPSMLLKFSSILRVETNKKSIVIRISEGKKKRKKNSTNNIFNGLEEQKKRKNRSIFEILTRIHIYTVNISLFRRGRGGGESYVSRARHTLLDWTNSYKRTCCKTPRDFVVQASL